MPAERTHPLNLASFRYSPKKATSTTKGNRRSRASSLESTSTSPQVSYGERHDFAVCDIYYPSTPSERDAFRTDADKRVPPHHWAVYDLIREIPAGKVSTYKEVCEALGEGSPRSVGGALRNNPFAPRIPCHRVIASNFFVGGFKGEWTHLKNATHDAQVKKNWHEPFKGTGLGVLQNEKLRMLVFEGVDFGKDGKLMVGHGAIWKFGRREDTNG
ncbi:6-O-methylguanine DNA methyltransferase [Gloeopeniophorella convolvens]|nr:6-O-methylguanine DNA methyltransferase [Gloeopeniophorella convolvens]